MIYVDSPETIKAYKLYLLKDHENSGYILFDVSGKLLYGPVQNSFWKQVIGIFLGEANR